MSGHPDWCLGYMFGPLSFYSLPLQGWAPTRHFPHWIINRKHSFNHYLTTLFQKHARSSYMEEILYHVWVSLFKALRRQAGERNEHSTQFSSFTTLAINRFLLLKRVILCQLKDLTCLNNSNCNTETGITIFLFQTVFPHNIPSPRAEPYVDITVI